jgi:hypothetical protein
MNDCGSNPDKDKTFPLPIRSRPDLEPTQLSFQCVSEAISPGVEQLKYETDHQPQSRAKVKNAQCLVLITSYASWHRDNCLTERKLLQKYRHT